MSLSRRTFTKEFKETAVRRLELGASVAEVARACEVNPNVLHRWRRELREYAAKTFPVKVAAGPRRAGSPNWSVRSAVRRWKSIFCGDACSVSRSSEGCRH